MSSAYGLVSKITLPDGSEVWLNSGSKLHYPKQFVGDHRKVYLSGEAYFKVSSDKKHRFDVALSNGITVSAYGTEFNINAYNTLKKINDDCLISFDYTSTLNKKNKTYNLIIDDEKINNYSNFDKIYYIINEVLLWD